MIIALRPKLEGLAERRFFDFARQILDRQVVGNPGRYIGTLVEKEIDQASKVPALEGQNDVYTASVRVLGDLAQLRWKLVDSEYGLELHSPHPQDDRVFNPTQSHQRKESIRRELRPRVLQQFRDPTVRKFIRKMERPPKSSNQKSIRTLIADGAELQTRLYAARKCVAKVRGQALVLRDAIQPYLQLVDGNERDVYTGIPLREIWRYMRYTWSIPQTPIPGRSLHYLIRDAAHETHAVIGIAALNNCAVRLEPRDRVIGWSVAGLRNALTALLGTHEQQQAQEVNTPHGIQQWLKSKFSDISDPRESTKCNVLESIAEWLQASISTAISDIECQGLATVDEIATPTDHIIERLQHLGREFATNRKYVLSDQNENETEEIESLEYANIPVDENVLDLEARHSANPVMNRSRQMLIRKKRAFELARLLDAQRVLTTNREAIADPATAIATVNQEEVRKAISIALSATKSRGIGTNLLEITTCGAVAPYNRMLGGKLIALMLLSPQVAADYQQRYKGKPSIIRSQLKNSQIIPDTNLVWLGTTSLFGHGSSQYERLSLPAEVIAPDQPEIRYCYLGNTTGYGTVQFSDDTVRALERVLLQKLGYREVNSVFGEGASPRLRKLRTGLDAIGFNPNLMMLHHQERRIYGMPLFAHAGAYLCGLEQDVPSYIAAPEAYSHATERIVDFWRQRWLSSRLAHEPSWTRLGETRPWLLSSNIPWQDPSPHAIADDVNWTSNDRSASDNDQGELQFWRKLAQAGSNAVSEGLTNTEFEALHLSTQLERYLCTRARDGVSIILTGNAGDGKTHLARALKHGLGDCKDLFEFVFDATAEMTSKDGVSHLIERWQRTHAKGKNIVLAINQFPLYMLRQQLPEMLPDLSRELEQQWQTRLTSGPTDQTLDDGSLLLVDLSLRNPLAPEFSRNMLQKMVSNPAVCQYAASGENLNFSYNFNRLVTHEVQNRLLRLFNRIISAGHRATVRELWILIARLLFGTETTGETPGSSKAWYSERLFEYDARFPLSEALRSVADPARVSHPHIDRLLESPEHIRAEEWIVGNETPNPLPSPVTGMDPAYGEQAEYGRQFRALKRRFYFEHREGGETVFKLDPSADARFHKMLQDPDDDAEHLSLLIEAINYCYFPRSFNGIKDKLCLWISHRLDEQPTNSFVADEFIPRERLYLWRPEPPRGLKDAFGYEPDHLLLRATSGHNRALPKTALRIDAAVFRTLWTVYYGLPRHLINLGELNRLDTFLDHLRGLEPSRLSGFLIYNAEHVSLSQVKMAARFESYLSANQL